MRINEYKVMYNNGICPHCGYDSDGTICDTYNAIIKKIDHSPWWRLWERDVSFVGKDEKSKEYLKK
jgi:hypothetical protein